mmetsp:Transcript_31299/g.52189  ORF Transcript_31299/g.52189 Transcript_31299/m.52189 type:complete len:125 (-) Transcript_31299:110-484(-)
MSLGQRHWFWKRTGMLFRWLNSCWMNWLWKVEFLAFLREHPTALFKPHLVIAVLRNLWELRKDVTSFAAMPSLALSVTFPLEIRITSCDAGAGGANGTRKCTRNMQRFRNDQYGKRLFQQINRH